MIPVTGSGCAKLPLYSFLLLLVTLLAGESLFALDKKSQSKCTPVKYQGIVGKLRPGLDFNPASLKLELVSTSTDVKKRGPKDGSKKIKAVTNPSQNLSKANLKALFLGILNLGKPFKDIEEMKTETDLTNAKLKTYDLSEDGRVTRNIQARGKENMRAKLRELPAAVGRNLNTCVCRHDLFNRKPQGQNIRYHELVNTIERNTSSGKPKISNNRNTKVMIVQRPCVKEWVKETRIERTDMQISNRLNLSVNSNFEPLQPKRTGFQPQQKHNSSPQKTRTKQCLQRNKIRKTGHKSRKMHKSKKRSNLCENIDFEPLPPKWTGFQPHREHNETTQTLRTEHCIQGNELRENTIITVWKTLLSSHGKRYYHPVETPGSPSGKSVVTQKEQNEKGKQEQHGGRESQHQYTWQERKEPWKTQLSLHGKHYYHSMENTIIITNTTKYSCHENTIGTQEKGA